MPGRQFSAGSGYRYGFNGKENDGEIKGDGNQQDYGMRIYDPRLGRFLSVDPLQEDYPELTPYQFSSNTPIQAIDLDGLERYHYVLTLDNRGKTQITFEKSENFSEWQWNPGGTGLTDWWLWEKVDNPRVEHIVHYRFKDVIVTEALAFEKEQDLTVKYNSEAAAFKATIGDFEKAFTFLDIQKGVAAGLSSQRSVSATNKFSTFKKSTAVNHGNNTVTNKSASSVHNGNTEAATANNAARSSITFEGANYEVKAEVPYQRPTNATTVAQRKAVNQANAQCATCKTTQGPFVADHKTPLAIEHISTGTIDKKKMRSLDAVQPQCQGCSNKQSTKVRKASQDANKIIKKKQANNGT